MTRHQRGVLVKDGERGSSQLHMEERDCYFTLQRTGALHAENSTEIGEAPVSSTPDQLHTRELEVCAMQCACTHLGGSGVNVEEDDKRVVVLDGEAGVVQMVNGRLPVDSGCLRVIE